MAIIRAIFRRNPLPQGCHGEVALACLLGAGIARLRLGPRQIIRRIDADAVIHNLSLGRSMLIGGAVAALLVFAFVLWRDRFRVSLLRLAEVVLAVVAVIFLWKEYHRAEDQYDRNAGAIKIIQLQRVMSAKQSSLNAQLQRTLMEMEDELAMEQRRDGAVH